MGESIKQDTGISVVIPTYRARSSILDVISGIGPEVDLIFVVDDACPEGSGLYVRDHCDDLRVRIIYNEVNLGVGGATMAGYRAAESAGAAVVVKLDADGQMDPSLISHFVEPILAGRADYTKGNRFFNAFSLNSMPYIRVFGNAILSFMTKLSCGYWHIFDPTNGYTAIHAKLIPLLPDQRIANRFFFETDVLFFLGLLRAVVIDVPMVAHYGSETSNLRVRHVVFSFSVRHLRRFVRRVVLNYFVRDFSFASLSLLVGVPILLFGVLLGLSSWVAHMFSGTATPTGTIVLVAITILFGLQLVLFFFSADIAAVSREPLHVLLNERVVYPLSQFAQSKISDEPAPKHNNENSI